MRLFGDDEEGKEGVEAVGERLKKLGLEDQAASDAEGDQF